MPSHAFVTTITAVISLLTSSTLALPQFASPGLFNSTLPPVGGLPPIGPPPGFSCPADTTISFCAGLPGLTPLLITCSNGKPTPTNCITSSGPNARCYSVSPTSGDASCSEAPSDAPPLVLPSFPASGARPTDGHPKFPHVSASATSTPCDSISSSSSEPTESPNWGHESFYLYPPPLRTATGARFPPYRPQPTGGAGYSEHQDHSTMQTLGSTWGPKPTQPSASPSPAPSASYIGGQSNGAVSKTSGWTGVLVVAALMAAMAV